MFEEVIKNLIDKKHPGFSQKHENINELIKRYEPEILSVFNDIADMIIKSIEES